jgi:hypothetical protein
LHERESIRLPHTKRIVHEATTRVCYSARVSR